MTDQLFERIREELAKEILEKWRRWRNERDTGFIMTDSQIREAIENCKALDKLQAEIKGQRKAVEEALERVYQKILRQREMVTEESYKEGYLDGNEDALTIVENEQKLAQLEAGEKGKDG